MRIKPLSITIASTLVTFIGLAVARPAAAASRANPECVGEWIICETGDPWQDCFSDEDAMAICQDQCPGTGVFWAMCDQVDCYPDAGAECYFGDT